MKQPAAKAILALLVGVTLTVVSLNFRLVLPAPTIVCFGTHGSDIVEMRPANTQYFEQGYPFTARQVPTNTICGDAAHYFWLGAAGDLLFWSLVGDLVSLVAYPPLARYARHIVPTIVKRQRRC